MNLPVISWISRKKMADEKNKAGHLFDQFGQFCTIKSICVHWLSKHEFYSTSQCAENSIKIN